MRKRCIAYTTVWLLLLFPLYVQASDSADVVITNMSYDEEYSENFESTVKVRFTNKSMYNGDIYLSYHVFDETETNLLQYENQRIKLNLDEQGEATCTVLIDLKDIFKETDSIVLRYDIVDQSNLYWFSDNPEIVFSTISINCKNDWGKANIRTLTEGVTLHPIIFAINIVISIVMSAMAIHVKNVHGKKRT